MTAALARVYTWLIIHDRCLCHFGLSPWCGWLDKRLLWFP